MEEKVIKSLKLLGINSYSQLIENEIIYWWEKKYIEIQESSQTTKVKSELIIELIEAKEYLEGIDKETLQKTFDKLLQSKKRLNESTLKNPIKFKEKEKIKNRIIWIKNACKGLLVLVGLLLLIPIHLKNLKNKKIACDSRHWENGNTYVGNCLKGNRHGQGVMSWSNGDWYKGEFINDKEHGDGYYEYSNGESYSGEFLNGQKHGRGTYRFPNVGVYRGEFLKDQMNGVGTYLWSNGDKYVGGFLNGQKHGRGTYNHSNGDKYVGEYLNGKRHGQGTYYFSRGNGWVGQWSAIKNKKGVLVGQ